MLRVLLLAAVVVAGAAAQNTRALVLSGSQYATATLPSGAAPSGIAQSRLEFRIYNFSNLAPSQVDYPLFVDSMQCWFQGNPQLWCKVYPDGQDHLVSLSQDLTGRTDVRVRVQADYAAGSFSLEIWNGDGSGYAVKTMTFASATGAGPMNTLYLAGVPWASPMPISYSFFRWYSSTVPLNSRPPGEVPVTVGNVLDYEFENSLNDSSGRRLNLSTSSGTAAFAAAPVYPPNATVKAPVALRAGTSFLADASSSFSSVGNGSIASFRWRIVDEPAPATIATPLAQTTNVTLPVFGTYTLQLTVTDTAGLTSTANVDVGAVATDDNDIVIVDDPNVNFVLGPLTRSGTSPWPFFDATEKTDADLLGPIIPPTPGNNLLAGTVAIAYGNPIATGTGTHFLSDFACNGSDYIMIHYPIVGGGGATGMRDFIVESCASDTSMTIYPPFNEDNVAASGVSYAKVTNNDLAPWMNGSNNYDYYDTVLAFYRLYYRTGLDVYLNYARTLADSFWQFPLDEGRSCRPDDRWNCSAPRIQAVMGMIMRALDGRPDMWPWIVALVQDDWANTDAARLGSVAENDWDIREFGYTYWFAATLAQVHPDPAVRASELQMAQNGFYQLWKLRQRSDGSWRMILDPSQQYAGAGTLEWQMPFPMKGLIALHRQTGDPNVLASLQQAVNFIGTYGYWPLCRGLLYSVLYTECAGGPCGTCTFQNGTTGGCSGADQCTPPPILQMGERTLSNAVFDSFGYLYYVTGDASYRTMGDNLFSANYGGAGGGPGADGGGGDFADLSIYGLSSSGKEYGFTAGAGSAQSYLAYRLRAPAGATLRSIPVSFSLTDVPNAASVNLHLTSPSGAQTDTLCTSSPCTVSVDARQGNYLIEKQYLSSTGSVLASGEPSLLRVN
jgi:hypothetical protein